MEIEANFNNEKDPKQIIQSIPIDIEPQRELDITLEEKKIQISNQLLSDKNILFAQREKIN